MTDIDQLRAEMARMTKAVANLAAQLSPWISTTEMCARYDCTPKTLNAMERRGDIPWRVKGRWNRAEVIEWEMRDSACSDQVFETGPVPTEPVVEFRALLLSAMMATEPRPAPGVYFLLSEVGQIIYVGQSINVLSRMAGHKGKKFHAVKMLHVAEQDERLALEMKFIKFFAPPENVVGMQKKANHD